MYLAFDTETTSANPNSANLVQLAAALFDDDNRTLRAFESIIYPAQWEITEEAARIHHINTDYATRWGESLEDAIYHLEWVMDGAKGPFTLVGHNVDYDRGVIRRAFNQVYKNADMKEAEDWYALPRICTMKSATDVCKLPGKYAGKWKWPTLTEAHTILCGGPFEGAHSAMADVDACRRVFWKLKERGAL